MGCGASSFQWRVIRSHRTILLMAAPRATPNPNQTKIHIAKLIGLLQCRSPAFGRDYHAGPTDEVKLKSRR